MDRITPVSWRTLAKVFEHEGFQFVRQKGDHVIYTKPGVKRPIVIPMYDAIPVFIIKNNLRSAGIDRERYFELIEKL